MPAMIGLKGYRMTTVVVDSAAKWCKWCNQAKPRSAFRGNKTYADKLNGRCRECQSRQDADHYRKNKDEICKRTNDAHLVREFGITRSEYDKMVAARHGLCDICKKSQTPKRLAVDHCHDTGRIRGLLCQSCNMGMGLLGDDPDRLIAAVNYLKGFNDAT